LGDVLFDTEQQDRKDDQTTTGTNAEQARRESTGQASAGTAKKIVKIHFEPSAVCGPCLKCSKGAFNGEADGESWGQA